MRKRLCRILLSATVLLLAGCGKTGPAPAGQTADAGKNVLEEKDSQTEQKNFSDSEEVESEKEQQSFVISSGKTLKERIRVPEGYQRVSVKKGSFGDFLRNYKLKEDGSPVLLYDGTESYNQSDHMAVFKLPIEKEDLQQCADSVMRVYGEYYYKKGQYGKIAFSLGGGFRADFRTWSQRNGIAVNGNHVSWTLNPKNDSSYASFKRFMRIVFAYSGTLNLEEDSKKIKLKDLRIGDIFIKGGSPGHVVMVVDVSKNADGRKAFLLAQGYMPAQEFHVVKNPLHEEDPWYYEEEVSYPFMTASYTFEKGALRRLNFSGS